MTTRRQFATTASLAAASLSLSRFASAEDASKPKPFGMKFAPKIGAFKAHAGPDILDQIRFAHDQGFTAWEHNGMPKEEPARPAMW